FVAMNYLQHLISSDDRRTRKPEIQLRLPAIGAFKGTGERALKRQATPLTKRRFNETHRLPATAPNKAFSWRSPGSAPKRAGLGIKEPERRIQPGSCRLREKAHGHP